MTTTERSASPDTPKLLTVTETCETLRISRWMFYRLVHQRRLQTIKIGKRRLVTTAALVRYLDEVSEWVEAD
jgi:excisionase family DNA binding protein